MLAICCAFIHDIELLSWMNPLAQVLVRNLDDAVLRRFKQRAQRENVSLEETLRRVLTQAARPSRMEIVEEARRIREKIGSVPGDSTVLIREDRDNDEPYR